LAAASAVVSHEALKEEYEALFVGVGKPPVMLYASYYLSGFMMEKPLAALREDLARLGFARDPAVHEPEDHLAALCDVMRALILGDVADKPASLSEQRAFFRAHLQPWVRQCCDATTKYVQANYYAKVAAFALAFFNIEIAAFEIE
jgi:TorA maturation chaperone TorD